MNLSVHTDLIVTKVKTLLNLSQQAVEKKVYVLQKLLQTTNVQLKIIQLITKELRKLFMAQLEYIANCLVQQIMTVLVVQNAGLSIMARFRFAYTHQYPIITIT